MCELDFFPMILENELLKVARILGSTFFRQEKTSKDSKWHFSIYCNWVLWSIDRLQLPFICVEDAVSFSNKKRLAQNSKFIYDKQIWKQMFAEILRFK